MKKKFVKVMLFGALTLAVSTTITSCKDYDDDVKNLQEQIDKINSGSPVSIEDMKTAIAAAKTELATEIDKLSKALENKDASIKALEDEIADLKTKLSAAQGDATAAKELATALSAKQNELKQLVDANDETLTALKASYDKLTGAEGDLATLKKFVADYQANSIISEYAKSDELLAGFVNSTIAGQLEGKGLVEYIENAVSTSIATKLAKINKDIEDITGENGALAQLEDKLDKALEGDDSNKGIKGRLNDLEDTKKVIEDFLKAHPEQYADFAAILNQIETLRSDYETMFTPESLQSKVEEALKSVLEDADFTFKSLVETVKQHGLDIEAIKEMVQSVVYVPKNVAGTEEFTTLYAKANPAAEFGIISRSKDLAVKFRVSPAKAALGFENGKYTTLLDAQAITRSTSIFEVGEISVEKENGVPTGIITVPLIATSASTDYALCLMIQSKEAGTEVASDITSSYFPVLMTEKYMTDVQYVTAETGRDIIYNEKESSLIFGDNEAQKKYGKTQAKLYDDEATAETNAGDFEDVPEGIKGIFNTKFELSGDNASYFQIVPTTGEVKLSSSAFNQIGLVGQTVDVVAKTTVAGIDDAFSTTLTSGNAVTIAQKSENLTPNYSFNVNWDNTDEQTLDINMVDLYNKGAITEAAYKALATSVFAKTADQGVDFTVGADNVLTVTVPQGKVAGTYKPKVVITVSDVKTITVTATVTIKALTDVALTEPAANVKVDAGVTGGNAATAIAVEVGDVSTLFSNYTEINDKVTAVGGSISFSVEGDGASLVGQKLTITKDCTGLVKVIATVKCGEAKDAKYTATVYADSKLSGKWTVPAAASLAKTISPEKTAKIENILTGFIWKDYRDKVMWKDGAVITGDNSNGFASSVEALDIYGLEAPTVELTGANADKFKLSADYKELSYSDKGQNLASREGLSVTIKVTVNSPWGGVIPAEGITTTMTVTVK